MFWCKPFGWLQYVQNVFPVILIQHHGVASSVEIHTNYLTENKFLIFFLWIKYDNIVLNFTKLHGISITMINNQHPLIHS